MNCHIKTLILNMYNIMYVITQLNSKKKRNRYTQSQMNAQQGHEKLLNITNQSQMQIKPTMKYIWVSVIKKTSDKCW